MRYVFATAALAVFAATAQADDHVAIEYHPGYTMSGRSITITIDRPFDKGGMVVPEVFKRLKAINALKTKSFVVPDAAYITIVAEMEGQQLEASSSHLNATSERQPKTTAFPSRVGCGGRRNTTEGQL